MATDDIYEDFMSHFQRRNVNLHTHNGYTVT